MNQREREQQHGIHTLCESLCLSVYLPGNNYRINKAPNIPRSLFVPSTLSIFLSAMSICLSVSFHFHFVPDIDSYDLGDGFLCLFPVNHSIIYRGSSQNMKKKPTGILYLLQFIVNCCTEYLKTQNRNLLVICIAFES